jgi:hypothetical protein
MAEHDALPHGMRQGGGIAPAHFWTVHMRHGTNGEPDRARIPFAEAAGADSTARQ